MIPLIPSLEEERCVYYKDAKEQYLKWLSNLKKDLIEACKMTKGKEDLHCAL